MKEFIVTIGLFIVFTLALFYQRDYNMHQEEIHKLKFVSEEVAASAAQYFERDRYGDGFYVFNVPEGIKGAEQVLKTNLHLNDDLSPKSYSYWRNVGKIQYTMEFISSTSTTRVINGEVSTDVNEVHVFPKTISYSHFGKTRTSTLFGPSVIVTVNTGIANYSLISNSVLPTNYRVAIHTLEE